MKLIFNKRKVGKKTLMTRGGSVIAQVSNGSVDSSDPLSLVQKAAYLHSLGCPTGYDSPEQLAIRNKYADLAFPYAFLFSTTSEKLYKLVTEMYYGIIRIEYNHYDKAADGYDYGEYQFAKISKYATAYEINKRIEALCIEYPVHDIRWFGHVYYFFYNKRSVK